MLGRLNPEIRKAPAMRTPSENQFSRNLRFFGTILLVISIDCCLDLIIDHNLTLAFFVVQMLHNICHGNDRIRFKTV